MPKLIVTSRYLKSGSGKNLSNYVKYIATREGSVTVKENNGTTPATPKQQEFILFLLKEFPESKETFEYDDYKNDSTQKNASRFILEMLERNADRISDRENYVGYLANRPGAVKFGSHGLFSQEDTSIDLEKTAKEIANHKGNVWTHVVSLRRDNAQKMGYDNLNAWRELVKRQIPNIAQAQKIDMKNLKWYAAFHDKKNNPHVHIIVYSTDEREGFLTNKGIEKIRSGFANDIYSDELHHLYEQQTDLRNLLKKESAALMHTLAENLKHDPNADKELCDLIMQLHDQLTNVKGKKVYGYLKPEVKDTVDIIFERLADNESIKKMYALWCDMEQTTHDIYSSAKVDFPAMIDNPHFKSVKNMIVKAVSEIYFAFPGVETEVIPDDVEDDTDISFLKEDDRHPLDTEDSNGEIYFKCSEDISCGLAMLTESAGKSDSSEAYKLVNIYFKGEYVDTDYDKAEKYLKIAVADSNEYAMYSLANLYLTETRKDIDKAANLLKQCCNKHGNVFPYAAYSLAKLMLQDNPYHNVSRAVVLLKESAVDNNWSAYLLGKLYLFGNGEIKQNKNEAVYWLTKSANDGNKFAETLILNNEQYESAMLTDTIFGLFSNLSRCIEDDYMREHRKLQYATDKKLRRMIVQKKAELGVKDGYLQQQIY